MDGVVKGWSELQRRESLKIWTGQKSGREYTLMPKSHAPCYYGYNKDLLSLSSRFDSWWGHHSPYFKYINYLSSFTIFVNKLDQ